MFPSCLPVRQNLMLHYPLNLKLLLLPETNSCCPLLEVRMVTVRFHPRLNERLSVAASSLGLVALLPVLTLVRCLHLVHKHSFCQQHCHYYSLYFDSRENASSCSLCYHRAVSSSTLEDAPFAPYYHHPPCSGSCGFSRHYCRLRLQ